jgi:hypothetical protein
MSRKNAFVNYDEMGRTPQNVQGLPCLFDSFLTVMEIIG